MLCSSCLDLPVLRINNFFPPEALILVKNKIKAKS